MSLWQKVDSRAGAPKYLKDSAEFPAANTSKDYGGPTYNSSLDNAVFVDTVESGVASNRARGVRTAGWNLYKEFGNGRHYVETLVACKATPAQAGDAGVVLINAANTFTGGMYTIVTTGTTVYTTVGAANNNVATTYTATAPATGTGTVVKYNPVAAANVVANNTYLIISTGTTDFTLVGSTSSNVATSFVATGPATGTGLVVQISGDNQIAANA